MADVCVLNIKPFSGPEAPFAKWDTGFAQQVMGQQIASALRWISGSVL
jgi:hypothetical protein